MGFEGRAYNATVRDRVRFEGCRIKIITGYGNWYDYHPEAAYDRPKVSCRDSKGQCRAESP